MGKVQAACKRGHDLTPGNRTAHGACRTCVNNRARIWTKENRTKINAGRQKWLAKRREDPEYRAQKRAYERTYSRTYRSRFSDAKQHAKRHSRQFTIPFDSYVSLLCLPCHYCGRKLNETSVGLDRIDSTIGYVLHNVVPCCWECSMIKGSTLAYDEARATIRFLTNFRRQKSGLSQDPQSV